MRLYLYDTKSQQKRLFEPIQPNHVKVYVCGPTVYDRVHIGNGLSAVVFDVLIRLLRVLYSKVTYVRNITDIDDKIINAARESDEPCEHLTNRFIRAFHEDVNALFVLAPDVEPKPTELIESIIEMISRLIDRGHAYESKHHVLFHVPSFPKYGELSHRTLDEMIDGARVEVAPYKRDPKDFILWKPSLDSQPGWESPWGRGRPGWHIECSAMIRQHLGAAIDIHGAGVDLIFPHNENELAQSVCDDEHETFVNYWVHNGMLNLGGRKMSKSLGNILTIRDALATYTGEEIRYALLTGHYRQSLLWTEQLLKRAKQSLKSLYGSLRHATEIIDDHSVTEFDRESLQQDDYPIDLMQALLDDLHTPKALSCLHSIAKELNASDDPEVVLFKRNQLLAGGWLLGLLNQSVTSYFQQTAGTLDKQAIESLINERNQCRRSRDFARADQIRKELLANGVELEDTRTGTRWKILN